MPYALDFMPETLYNIIYIPRGRLLWSETVVVSQRNVLIESAWTSKVIWIRFMSEYHSIRLFNRCIYIYIIQIITLLLLCALGESLKRCLACLCIVSTFPLKHEMLSHTMLMTTTNVINITRLVVFKLEVFKNLSFVHLGFSFDTPAQIKANRALLCATEIFTTNLSATAIYSILF